MSPRAAWRLERLGYTVYDYTGGKADWLAAGLDTIRSAPAAPRVIDVLTREVPTCAPDTPAADLDRRVPSHVVVNHAHIVLGRVASSHLDRAPPGVTVEQVMRPGPATIRPDADLEETRERLRRRQVPQVLVTTPEGRLLGVLAARQV